MCYDGWLLTSRHTVAIAQQCGVLSAYIDYCFGHGSHVRLDRQLLLSLICECSVLTR